MKGSASARACVRSTFDERARHVLHVDHASIPITGGAASRQARCRDWKHLRASRAMKVVGATARKIKTTRSGFVEKAGFGNTVSALNRCWI